MALGMILKRRRFSTNRRSSRFVMRMARLWVTGNRKWAMQTSKVVHEAGDRTFALAAAVSHDARRKLACNCPARELVGCLHARALHSGHVSSSILAAKLHMRYTRQRWRAVRRKHSSIALMMPGAPSEVTNSGSLRPFLFMSSKKAITVSASSFEPAIRCTRTR